MLGSIRAAAILAAALCSAPAVAQDDEDAEGAPFDRTPEDCIPASRIDSTEVIDDNTIVFHMRGRDEVYVNYLPRRCPNLAREDRFTYRLRSTQLCSVETITVIEDFGFRPGFTCRLGDFYPVTVAEVEELKRIAEGEGSSGDAIEIEQVELPDDANDGGDEETAAADGDGQRGDNERRRRRDRDDE